MDQETIDDTAADVLLRGFGVCDQADFAFARLANELDVPGRLLFLRQPDGVSPHSTAELFLSGEWRIFDPFYGMVARAADGEIATRQDLATEPRLRPYSQLDPGWYQAAQPVPLVEATSGVGGSVVETLAEFAASLPPPVVDALQDAYLALPPPRYVDHNDDVEDFETPDARLYFEGRNFQVFRRTSDAQASYEALTSQYPKSDYADDAVYQLGLMALEDGQEQATIRQMETLRAAYPDSRWHDESIFLEARATEAVGDCARARTLYEQVDGQGRNGSEEAREHLSQLNCG
jgi:hypothetical protein